jgi:hypothetical protein
MYHWQQPGRAGSDEPSQETCLGGIPCVLASGKAVGWSELRPPFETRGGFFTPGRKGGSQEPLWLEIREIRTGDGGMKCQR